MICFPSYSRTKEAIYLLVQSTYKNEKIVLGLLSYTEENVSMDELRELLEEYRESDKRELWLYKEEENDNFIGIVGLEYLVEDDMETLRIERIALIPSFRSEGVGYQMYAELHKLYPNAELNASLITSELVVKWAEKYHKERA